VKTAFVLGGGGMLGAYEVGMLRALSEAGITPDVVGVWTKGRRVAP
jgi:NTE family protein